MFSIIPGNDKKQAFRIKRLLTANAFCAVFAIVSIAVMKSDLVDMTATHLIFYFMVLFFVQLLLYMIIRSGINKSFKDPSMTLSQIIAAIIYITYFMYYIQDIRGAVMVFYLLTILFGSFQLTLPEFVIVSLAALTGYGAIIILNILSPPLNFNLAQNLVQWVICALCLSWLTYIGNYMNSIRKKLKRREAELTVSKSNLREAVLEIRQNAEILNDSSLELSETNSMIIS